MKELKYKIDYNNLIEPHFIDGQDVEIIDTNKLYNVHSPLNNKLIKKIALDDINCIDFVIKSSNNAFNNWKNYAMHKKINLLIKFYSWIDNNKKKFIDLIVTENGKPVNDAEGEFQRGLEVLQYAISLQSTYLGRNGNINKDITVSSLKEPIGIVLAICPFNFPFMIPMWFIPISIVLGNVIIVKPSEKVSGCVSLLAKGAIEVGIPNGIINMIHGGKDIVNSLIMHKKIKAVSFVGSTKIGKEIHSLATKNNKKIQCNMGAKNHAVITKNSNIEDSINGIVSAAFGGCGQRCMALSVVIIVGENKLFIEKLIEKTKKINIIEEMGPLISKESIININNKIDASNNDNLILLDRRNEIKNEGNYMGPVIIKTNSNSLIYKEELFGPVLSIINCNNLIEAINIINSNDYGNGTCLYSDSLTEINLFKKDIEVGQIGINVPIPVPPPYFSWSSSKDSFIGSNYIYGPQSIDFYTKTKTILERSNNTINNTNLSMPTN